MDTSSLRANIPAGGKPGQVLTKESEKDYDVVWKDTAKPEDIPENLQEQLDELQESKQDNLVGEQGQYVTFDKDGNPVSEYLDFDFGEEITAISDHRLLSHKDDPGQHSIESIKGLNTALEDIKESVRPITNLELEVLFR